LRLYYDAIKPVNLKASATTAGVYEISEQVTAVKTRKGFLNRHQGVSDEDAKTVITPEERAPETPADQG
jgi:hypothetical protein